MFTSVGASARKMAFVAFPCTGSGFTSRFSHGSTHPRVTQEHFRTTGAFRRLPRRAQITAAAPRIVSADELEEVLKSKPGPIICDMFAPWCGPCQFLVPELERLAEKMGDRIQILKLDTDKDQDYATAIGVRGLPTLYFIKDGQLKHKMEGAMTAEDLEQLAEYYFFDGPEPKVPQADIPVV